MSLRPVPPSPSKEDFRLALQKFESLHGNMAVLAKLGALLREPDTGIDQISRLLQTDGALCANIIRLSNSAIYGSGSRSANVSEALAKVGFNRFLSVLGTAFSKRLFMHDLAAYGMSANDYWAYSYFCGVLLEEQAMQVDAAPDDAYMVGLLHALGRVVINELLIQTRLEIYWDPSLPAEEWESIVVGFRNDEAGAHLLRSWKFGPEVHQRVADQNNPAQRAADSLLRLLDFARRTAELNHFRINAPSWTLPVGGLWESAPGYDPDTMASAVNRARRACIHVVEVLKVA